jgi:hypothetical protein
MQKRAKIMSSDIEVVGVVLKIKGKKVTLKADDAEKMLGVMKRMLNLDGYNDDCAIWGGSTRANPLGAFVDSGSMAIEREVGDSTLGAWARTTGE